MPSLPRLTHKVFNAFEETMAEFDINTRLYTIVTDNATNIIKAFSLPGMECLRKITNDDDYVSDDGDDDNDDDDLQEMTVTKEFDFLPPYLRPLFFSLTPR